MKLSRFSATLCTLAQITWASVSLWFSTYSPSDASGHND